MKKEVGQEMGSTRRALERIPAERWGWRPHEKSMSLARLGSHMADIVGYAPAVLTREELDLAAGERPGTAESLEELLERWDGNVAAFRQALDGASEESMLTKFELRAGDQVYFKLPRGAAIRGFILSHLYHHRGQLSVYLRLLDVAVPPIYGPTADER